MGKENDLTEREIGHSGRQNCGRKEKLTALHCKIMCRLMCLIHQKRGFNDKI